MTYDQRMQRICTSLAKNGYEVLLVGRHMENEKPLDTLIFNQLRLPNIFQKGFLFYAEHNLRLFFFLLFKKYDILCTIDLDTMPGGCLAAMVRGKRRVFDAHEYFTEVPEIVDRPFVKGFWAAIDRFFTPKYHLHYTVGDGLAEIFSKKYGKKFHTIRSVPFRREISKIQNPASSVQHSKSKFILYQGALNEGRGLEIAIYAMEDLPLEIELWIAGEGDLSDYLRALAADSPARDRIKFLGFVKPADLKQITDAAWLGYSLLENRGLSYYFSLVNKFFDYVQAGVPVLSSDFPEYQKLNEQHRVAFLVEGFSAKDVVAAVQHILNSPEEYEKMKANCRAAAADWNWENEEKKLIDLWAF